MKVTLDTDVLLAPIKALVRTKSRRMGLLLVAAGVPAVVLAVTKPYTFTDGTVISAAQINANFDALYSAVNELQGNNTTGPATCKTIYDANNNAADGRYYIDPDGAGGLRPFQVFCDMSGGGWTRVDELSQYGFGIHTEASYTQAYLYELSTSQINAIKAKSSSGKQDWDCRTLGVGGVYTVTGWDNSSISMNSCYDPGNTAYITSTGSITTLAALPIKSWNSYDCGDVTEACAHNVAYAYFK